MRKSCVLSVASSISVKMDAAMRSIAPLSAIVMRAAAGLLVAGWSAATRADDAWDAIVAKARAEGVVVVHGAPGKSYEAALVTAFNKTHPDIKVQFSGAANAVEIPKVLRERQAGIFAWDVWVSGPSSIMQTLKPAGAFRPLKPVLRADLVDDKDWIGGFDFGWMDNEKQFFYAMDGTVQTPILANWDVIKKAAFTRLTDLATPAFAGKIVWHDPRVNGTGNGTTQTLYRNIGEAALIDILRNKVTYTANGHQIAEWVVRGRYPIGIGLETSDLKEFVDQGLGKNVSPVPDDMWKSEQISVGFGGVGLLDKAPHPNAGVVYVNWLLSREGQEAWNSIPRVSRRTDVKPWDPALAPDPKREYFIGQAERHTSERVRMLQIARRAIDGQ